MVVENVVKVETEIVRMANHAKKILTKPRKKVNQESHPGLPWPRTCWSGIQETPLLFTLASQRNSM